MKRDIFVVVLLVACLVGVSIGCAKPAPAPSPTASPKPTQAPSPAATPTQAPVAQFQEMEIRLCHQNPITDPVHAVYMKMLTELVKERTNGKVKIVVYPAGQLYDETNSASAVSSGAVHMSDIGEGIWGSLLPPLQVALIPGAFSDLQHKIRAYQGTFGKLVDAALNTRNAKSLGASTKNFYYAYITTKKQVKVPADMKGLLMRTWDKSTSSMVELAGGTPVIIAAGEMYFAMQRGTIDGCTSSPETIKSRNLYEVIKYAVFHSMFVSMTIECANLQWWNSLSPDLRNLLQTAVEESRKALFTNIEAAQKTDADFFRGKGIELTYAEGAAAKPWMDAWRPMLDDYAAGRIAGVDAATAAKWLKAIDEAK